MSSASTSTVFRTVVLASLLGLSGVVVLSGGADARLGGGGSFGSRGSRTFNMPSATPTAPSVSPFQRSATPNFGNAGMSSGMRQPGMFGGGLGRGLIGGFLGAGLFGLLFGNGLFGGLGGGMSLIGLIFQLGLLYLGFRLVMGFFRNRRPAFGGASAFGGTPDGAAGSGFGGASNAPRTTPITIGPADYEAFERRLVDSQTAYSNGDVDALRRIATAEMLQNFESELAANHSQGVVNKIGEVHLLSGDLSEAWRENSTDYATVAMRFSLIDATIDQRSGQVVSGSSTAPQQVTEVWTFARGAGAGAAGWSLAAIQQA